MRTSNHTHCKATGPYCILISTSCNAGFFTTALLCCIGFHTLHPDINNIYMCKRIALTWSDSALLWAGHCWGKLRSGIWYKVTILGHLIVRETTPTDDASGCCALNGDHFITFQLATPLLLKRNIILLVLLQWRDYNKRSSFSVCSVTNIKYLLDKGTLQN